MADIEKAMKVAQKIGNAIVKKFPKHELFVRRTALADAGYIEIALRPDGGSYAQEVSTAYSDEYFSTANTDNLQAKAKTILKDFRLNFGVLDV
jgi:hypothetical protein